MNKIGDVRGDWVWCGSWWFNMLNDDATYTFPMDNLTGRLSFKELYNNYLKFIKLRRFTGKMGCDPEIFVEDKDGMLIPAFNFLGSKKDPTLKYGNHNKSIYWDGFAAEMEVNPDTCLAWVGDNIQCGLKELINKAQATYPGARLSYDVRKDLTPNNIMDAKPEHLEFGCMLSYNVYGDEQLNVTGDSVPFRTVGGHIHFGCGVLSKEQIFNIVKALDAILGVACTALFAGYDDPNRRELYGRAGEYRLPPHGLEYRTLSNCWMVHPIIFHLVFEISRYAFQYGYEQQDCFIHNEAEVIDIINKCDVGGAKKVIMENEIFYKAIFKIINDQKVGSLFGMLMNGMDSVINPKTIHSNWKLMDIWADHCDGENECLRTFEFTA